MFISNIKTVVIWVLRRIKISRIIFDEFVDFIKVIRIKMIAFYAEMSLDRFGKELRLISVGLGDFVRVVQSWMVALTFRLREVLNFAPRLIGLFSKLIELQKFSQLTSELTFLLNLFLQLISTSFYSRFFLLRVLPPKPTFLLN